MRPGRTAAAIQSTVPSRMMSYRWGMLAPMRPFPRPPATVDPTAGMKIGCAIAGGVVTYTAKGVLKIAVATGFVSPVWPVEIKTARIAILGVEGDTWNQ
jgi:hypothetical protein